MDTNGLASSYTIHVLFKDWVFWMERGRNIFGLASPNLLALSVPLRYVCFIVITNTELKLLVLTSALDLAD